VANEIPRLPIYVPPEPDSDEPLDPIEQAIVRLMVRLVVKEIREEEARAAGSTPPVIARQA
jgi:hypothetical protein